MTDTIRTYRVSQAELEAYEARRHGYLNKPLMEITEHEFNYQLNQLPPLRWMPYQGAEVFCCVEPMMDNVHSQFAKAGDRYFTKYVNPFKMATWISREQIDAFIEGDKVPHGDGRGEFPKSPRLLVQISVAKALAEFAIVSHADEHKTHTELCVEEIMNSLYLNGKLKEGW